MPGAGGVVVKTESGRPTRLRGAGIGGGPSTPGHGRMDTMSGQDDAERATDRRDLPEAAIRDHLANERTLLAWQRTALGVVAIGFLVDRFALEGGGTTLTGRFSGSPWSSLALPRPSSVPIASCAPSENRHAHLSASPVGASGPDGVHRRGSRRTRHLPAVHDGLTSPAGGRVMEAHWVPMVLAAAGRLGRSKILDTALPAHEVNRLGDARIRSAG